MSGSDLSATGSDDDKLRGSQRTYQDIIDFWIRPEVERRMEAGLAKPPFILHCAQILFGEGDRPTVRLNEEFRGKFRARVQGEIKVGDQLKSVDIENVERFELVDEDLDFAYIVLFIFKDKFFIQFDNKKNRSTAIKTIDRAEKYLEAATLLRSSGLIEPYIDNLFSACELLSKSHLVLYHDVRQVSGHGAIHSGINKWRNQGGVDSTFVAMFNKLAKLRGAARYQHGKPLTLSIETDPIEIARKELETQRKKLARLEAPS